MRSMFDLQRLDELIREGEELVPKAEEIWWSATNVAPAS